LQFLFTFLSPLSLLLCICPSSILYYCCHWAISGQLCLSIQGKLQHIQRRTLSEERHCTTLCRLVFAYTNQKGLVSPEFLLFNVVNQNFILYSFLAKNGGKFKSQNFIAFDWIDISQKCLCYRHEILFHICDYVLLCWRRFPAKNAENRKWKNIGFLEWQALHWGKISGKNCLKKRNVIPVKPGIFAVAHTHSNAMKRLPGFVINFRSPNFPF